MKKKFAVCLIPFLTLFLIIAFNQKEDSMKRTNKTTTVRQQEAHELSLKDFLPKQTLAAKVWLHEKGSKVSEKNIALHVRTFNRGDRVKPDSPKSATYPHKMIQIYSDDPNDFFNSITYTALSSNRVAVTHTIPASWKTDVPDAHYEDVVTLDTTQMLKTKKIISVQNLDSSQVLKIAKLIS